jgi:hypothetical protein
MREGPYIPFIKYGNTCTIRKEKKEKSSHKNGSQSKNKEEGAKRNKRGRQNRKKVNNVS